MAEVLVIQAARFGDLVQSRRLILTLGARHKTHLLVDKSLASLARILYPSTLIHAMTFHAPPAPDSMRENARILEELAGTGFHAVYNCNFSRLTAAICRMFPPDKVTGNRPLRNGADGVERSQWCRIAARMTAMRGLSTLNLVDFWAWFAQDPVAPADVNPAAAPGGGGLGIAVSGREARRSLPLPVLAVIAETVFKILGKPRILLLGAQAEAVAGAKLLHLFLPETRAKTENLCGKTDWSALCGALAGLDLLITPDTGIMHLAASLGTPVMAFFLSSAWCHETGPYGKGHFVWQTCAECSPCLESRPCAFDVKCLAPFRDPGFTRILALALQKKSLPPFPQGLQLWETDTDGLGALCRLRGGQDQLERQRMNMRSMLRAWLKLPGARNALDGRLMEDIFPISEWMLPGRRYF